MTGNSDLIQSPTIGQEIIKRVVKSTGQDPKTVRDVLDMGLPSLLDGMMRNAETPEGTQSIMSTITKYTGSSLDNLAGSFLGGLDLPFSEEDGDKMLNHVLGDKKEGILKKIGNWVLEGLIVLV